MSDEKPAPQFQTWEERVGYELNNSTHIKGVSPEVRAWMDNTYGEERARRMRLDAVERNGRRSDVKVVHVSNDVQRVDFEDLNELMRRKR